MCTFTVVGHGRVGRALSHVLPSPCRVVKRGGGVPAEEKGPVVICTTSDAVPQVYSALPPSRRADAVFVANGMLLRFFLAHNITDYTQVLLYMSADDDGGVVDGKRSAVTGRWADEVGRALTSGGVQCEVLPLGQFTARMVEKLVWASTLWLVCHAHGGLSVGDACKEHRDEIVGLVYELFPIAHLYALEAQPAYMQHYIDHPFSTEDVMEALFEYSASVASAIPSLDMARREYRWRNGFFIGRQPTPQHLRLLQRVGFVDMPV